MFIYQEFPVTKKVPELIAFDFILQIMNGIGILYKKGIIHRDIK